MAQESVQLVAADGRTTRGTADITRTSPAIRKTWAFVVLVVGFAAGAVSVLIPILHLFSTWILPLAAILVAREIWRREFSITSLQGDCPNCGSRITRGGRAMHNSPWQECPDCPAGLQVVPLSPK
jgi:predicted RNA-binding Zn-ribbon protein involved in translation (DUF1610 family)